MPHTGHDFPQRLVPLITKAVSIFVLIVVFYIVQYIFDMDFICSCRPGLHKNGILYLLIPPVILTWVAIITEPLHESRIFSIFHLLYRLSHNNCCGFFVKVIVSYFSMCAVWITSVLFDGDWYLCLMTNLNASHTGIPCRENLTYEEYRIKADYKTDSLDFGFYVICFLLVLWSLADCTTAYCIRRTMWKNLRYSKSPYYRIVYEDLLAEQVNTRLKKELTKLATKRAKAICMPYILAIGENEHQLNYRREDNANVNNDNVNNDNVNNDNVNNDNVNNTGLEAWKKISAVDFPFMDFEIER
ncbi:uncharacterized protein LOC127365507 [Dicentrarchus labrax]|uniref:uncharacterized protein LOC127365507 n=1 Tax=Dicentrarchus labrax TaxID=13489 RepID=UPI0021F58286|nr:uncharacterized protein LOC127365507 [Dicentrarchus labrax]